MLQRVLRCVTPFTSAPLPVTTWSSICTTTSFCKESVRRPRAVASGSGDSSGKASARRDSARQLAAESARQKWQQEQDRISSVTGRIPDTNVYFTSEFEQRELSIDEAICALREAAQEDMFDCLENPVKVKFVLNMRTKKQTKFVQKFEAHVIPTHLLDFLPRQRIIALCKDEEEAAACVEAGATHAGTTELFNRLEHGAFHWEEYDNVVATTDLEDKLCKLKHVLRDRLPTMKNGRIGDEVSGLTRVYATGIVLESTPLLGVPEVNHLELIIGQLSWPVQHLHDNLTCYCKAIESNKSPRTVGYAITSMILSCPPTDEMFHLDVKAYLPQPETTDSETVEAVA